MQAFILAAGEGKRLRPLTLKTPKPLIRILDKPLLHWHIDRLIENKVTKIVINVAYKADMIKAYIQDHDWPIPIVISEERQGALDTGGGIKHALEHISDDIFLVVSADIWTIYPFHHLNSVTVDDAYLVMVPNPSFHPNGDFALKHGLVTFEGKQRYTYGNIGLYRKSLFAKTHRRIFPVMEVLSGSIDASKVRGELYTGTWFNIGDESILNACEQHVKMLS